MISTTREELFQSITKVLSKEENFLRKSEFLRTEISAMPEAPIDRDLTTLVIPHVRELNSKICLGILSWFVPEEIHFQLLLFLDTCWGPELQEVKEVLLTSRDSALAWLQIQDRWNANDFYGNVLPRTLRQISVKFEHKRLSTKPVKKYTGWCRGHRESSRLNRPDSSKVLPTREEILRIEEESLQKEVELRLKKKLLFKKIEYQLRSSA